MPSRHVPRGQTKTATGVVSQVPLTFAAGESAAETKAALLKAHLGYDPRETVSLRATAMRETRAGGGGLPSDVEAQLARINASPHVKAELTAEDVYLHQIEAGSNRFVADRYCFLGLSTLQNVAAAADAGFSLMTRHATGGWAGDGENPYGCTFAGTVEKKGDISRALVQFYMLRDFTPNGKNAASTDDLHKGIVGGTFRDVSLGLCGTGSERIVCDVCERDLYDNECRHIPGYTIGMSPEDIAKQKARGVPEGRASYTMENWSASEVSLVYDGAIPGAGTAYAKTAPKVEPVASPEPEVIEPPASELAAQKPAAEPPPTEEPMKYSKELKLSIGLKEDATDAEVETRLAQLNKAEADSASFKQKADAEKVRADAAETETFKQKYAGRIADSVIDRLAKLPSDQREPIAEELAAQAKQEAVTPPIDGLAGTSAAAAPPVKQTLAGEWTEADERWREGLGIVESKEEVFRLLSVTPIGAFNKLFGTKLGETPHSKQAVMSRFAVFGLKQPATFATASK